MSVFYFIAAVIVTGAVLSLIPLKAEPWKGDGTDYHYVPYAGDALGSAN